MALLLLIFLPTFIDGDVADGVVVLGVMASIGIRDEEPPGIVDD